MCNNIPQEQCSGDPNILANGLLYLRWLQAAVTWPVFRTHASEWGLAVMERRVLKFPALVSGSMQVIRSYMYAVLVWRFYSCACAAGRSSSPICPRALPLYGGAQGIRHGTHCHAPAVYRLARG